MNAMDHGAPHHVSSVVMVCRDDCEEPDWDHKVGGYHPVQLGQIYHQNYQVVGQLGWGACSTVWLVKDIRSQQYAALKILMANLNTRKPIFDERAMLLALRDGDSSSQGRRHIVQLLDDLTETGPNGVHDCLVFEALSVNLLDIQRTFDLQFDYIPVERENVTGIPLPLVKHIFKHVLFALQFSHECGVVHADVRGDNILMAGTPLSLGQTSAELTMSDLMSATISCPQRSHVRNDLMSATFKLTDFGCAVNLMSKHIPDETIQPQMLRSPDVVIGAEWDTKVDIWSFGCLLFEFVIGEVMFPDISREDDSSSYTDVHLMQIFRFFGDFPRSLLDKGKFTNQYFDDQGRLRYNKAPDEDEPGTLTELLSAGPLHPPRAELDVFVDFLSRALIIDPAERWSAAQLLEHPWFADVM